MINKRRGACLIEPSTRLLRLKVFILAGLPSLAALVSIAVTVSRESEQAGNRAIESVQPLLRRGREAELRSYVGLALQAIQRAPSPDAALEVLRHLEFGWDGQEDERAPARGPASAR